MGHLYGEVRAYLSDDTVKTEEVLSEIADYGRAYQTFYGHLDAGSSRLSLTYKRLNLLRVQTAVPLLAWFRTLPATRLSTADHERAATAAESWVVRRMLVGGNTRGYGSAFMSVLRAGQAAALKDENIADAVIDAFSRSPNALAWPSDDRIATSFVHDTYYGRLTQERIRMLLGAIDAQRRIENTHTEPAAFDYAKLQIEHVMPRSWKAHWPIQVAEDAGPGAVLNAEWGRDSFVDRIGNLTLVTGDFNRLVSNQGWPVKRPALAAQSSLQLNGPLGAREVWDESAISERAADLARTACRVWPMSL